jgi:hypothetical protein
MTGIKKSVLYTDKLNGFDIIRLKEYIKKIFVSEKFVKAFKKNKFKGYSFREIELS